MYIILLLHAWRQSTTVRLGSWSCCFFLQLHLYLGIHFFPVYFNLKQIENITHQGETASIPSEPRLFLSTMLRMLLEFHFGSTHQGQEKTTVACRGGSPTHHKFDFVTKITLIHAGLLWLITPNDWDLATPLILSNQDPWTQILKQFQEQGVGILCSSHL